MTKTDKLVVIANFYRQLEDPIILKLVFFIDVYNNTGEFILTPSYRRETNHLIANAINKYYDLVRFNNS